MSTNLVALGSAAAQELARRQLARTRLLNFITRMNPQYVPGWFHEELCQRLEKFLADVEAKKNPRLMLFVPPQHGKSEAVSRKLPAWLLGRHPEWRIVSATYNQEFADKFGRDVRAILKDPIYGQIFPDTHIRGDRDAANEMEIEGGGRYYAVGRGGALTGMTADVILIDDPVKDQADADSEAERKKTLEWYQTVARTRLVDGGGIIILQTRWHEEDLSGALLAVAEANAEADQWEVISYPALAEKDEPKRKKGEALCPHLKSQKFLQTMRATLTPRQWAALYQQRPAPESGILFDKDNLLTYKELPKDCFYYVSTDFAVSEDQDSDYTVIVKVAVDSEFNIYVLPETFRDRVGPLKAIDALLDILKDDRVRQWAAERGPIMKSIGPMIERRGRERGIYCPRWDYTPTTDKVARSRSLQARVQQRKVFFHPAVLEQIEAELLSFPAGKHDDFVDALGLMVLMFDEMIEPAPTALPEIVEDLTDTIDDPRRNFDPSRPNRPSPYSLYRDR